MGGNTFVSENDPGIVTGSVDWQNTPADPLFLQVQWPVFLIPPKGYQVGHVIPRLSAGWRIRTTRKRRPNYTTRRKLRGQKITKSQASRATGNLGKEWTFPPELKEVFRRCRETCGEGLLPLWETLIETFLHREELGFTSRSLLLYFTDGQIA